MRFPLSMTAGIAGYIFRQKLRPRPEWQKNLAPKDDANPFRVLHQHKTGNGVSHHPMIAKRFPLVVDTRNALKGIKAENIFRL